MKIEILNDITINTGAPIPKILSSESRLTLIYYHDDGLRGPNDMPESRNPIEDTGVSIVRFDLPLNYKFGSPGEETLDGHPYYEYGLKHYRGHIINESPWIKELIKIDSLHPMHDIDRFKDYKHFLFSFHDTTFECIAKGFKVFNKKLSMYDLLISEVQEVFTGEY